MNYENYSESQPYLELLVNVYNARSALAEQHRDLRRLEIDIVTNRQAGRLDPDELMIPQRVIDTNIRREQSRYVSYVATSRRAAVFLDVENNNRPTDVIEKDFSTRIRYDGWEQETFKTIDGMQLHRYASFVLSLDETLPGHLRFSYVPFEDLLFPDDTRDLQACENCGRAIHYSKNQLDELEEVEGVNKDILAQINKQDPNTKPQEKENSLTTIYEFFFRQKGIVYTALYAQESGKKNTMSAWLREPKPLHLGKYTQELDQDGKTTLRKVYETNYPFVIVPYNISEDNTIYKGLGRADLDQYTQDAVTSLVSSYTTGVRRAAGFYWAEDGLTAKSSSTIEMTDVKIVPNRVIKGGIKQIQLNPPDASVISTANVLLSLNQQETSQVNYAALTRKDTEKTATEIDAAQNEANMLSAAQLSLFSNSLRELYTRAFDIISNRVINGLLKVSPALLEAYKRVYVIRPAGDVDVVERQQRLQAMMQAWPVLQNTGAASLFLADLLQHMFPDRAGAYIAALQEDKQKNVLLTAAAQIIQELATGPTGQPTPEAAANAQGLQQFMAQVQAVLQPAQKGSK